MLIHQTYSHLQGGIFPYTRITSERADNQLHGVIKCIWPSLYYEKISTISTNFSFDLLLSTKNMAEILSIFIKSASLKISSTRVTHMYTQREVLKITRII